MQVISDDLNFPAYEKMRKLFVNDASDYFTTTQLLFHHEDDRSGCLTTYNSLDRPYRVMRCKFPMNDNAEVYIRFGVADMFPSVVG